MTPNVRVPMVPGPVTVPPSVLAAHALDYPSGDLEPAFLELYRSTHAKLQMILATSSTIALMSGEAMVVLWGALKSVLQSGDRVLVVANGLFGLGFGGMAEKLGCDVRLVETPWDDGLDLDAIDRAAATFRPKLLTLVHCDTPSGTVTPVGAVGEIVRRREIPLFLVDAVASAGGMPIETDAWGVDLMLVGSQKCLVAPPDIGIAAVSERAWTIIDAVNYVGYDAFKPWRQVLTEGVPYTPNWHGTAALDVACQILLDEGLANVFARHEAIGAHCRARCREIGLDLYPRHESIAAPVVTALKVPASVEWSAFRRGLIERGVAVGGSWGPLQGKVFRVGHMGSQATQWHVNEALAAIAEVARM